MSCKYGRSSADIDPVTQIWCQQCYDEYTTAPAGAPEEKLTLRDRFANETLASLLAASAPIEYDQVKKEEIRTMLADMSYCMADVMLERRKK